MSDNITPGLQGTPGPNPTDGNPSYSFEQPSTNNESTPQPPYGNTSPQPNYYANGQATPPSAYSGAGQAPYPGAYPQYGTPMPGYQQYNQAPAIPGTTDSGYNIMAIVSLVGGIVSFFLLPFVGALVGIICGHKGVNQIKENGGQGHSMAVAGMVLGYINLGLSVIVGLILLFTMLVASAGVASLSMGPTIAGLVLL